MQHTFVRKKQSVSTIKSFYFLTLCYQPHRKFTGLFITNNVIFDEVAGGRGRGGAGKPGSWGSFSYSCWPWCWPIKVQCLKFCHLVDTFHIAGLISLSSLRLSSELQWPVETSLDTSSIFFSKYKTWSLTEVLHFPFQTFQAGGESWQLLRARALLCCVYTIA